MRYVEEVNKLNIKDKDTFLQLLNRSVADPVFYIIKVEERVGVSAIDYYKILKLKAEEENNQLNLKLSKQYLRLLGG